MIHFIIFFAVIIGFVVVALLLSPVITVACEIVKKLSDFIKNLLG